MSVTMMSERSVAPLHVRVSRGAFIAGLVVVGLILAMYLDLPVRHWVQKNVRNADFTDWGRMLRSGGYLPTWLLVMAALISVDLAAAGRACWTGVRRGIQLLLALAIGGTAGELAKLVFRRERPAMNEGHWYVFRPLSDHLFASGGLSMPSSHTTIAFAAAFTLARLFPAAGWVVIAFALGTGVSRVLTGAHYVSDVYIGMLVGAAGAWAADRFVRRISRAQPAEPARLSKDAR